MGGEKKAKNKKESHVVEIGPLLKKILDKQKENIKNATFGCVNASYYESGEIIAKKIMGKGGIKIVSGDVV